MSIAMPKMRNGLRLLAALCAILFAAGAYRGAVPASAQLSDPPGLPPAIPPISFINQSEPEAQITWYDVYDADYNSKLGQRMDVNETYRIAVSASLRNTSSSEITTVTIEAWSDLVYGTADPTSSSSRHPNTVMRIICSVEKQLGESSTNIGVYNTNFRMDYPPPGYVECELVKEQCGVILHGAPSAANPPVPVFTGAELSPTFVFAFIPREQVRYGKWWFSAVLCTRERTVRVTPVLPSTYAGGKEPSYGYYRYTNMELTAPNAYNNTSLYPGTGSILTSTVAMRYSSNFGYNLTLRFLGDLWRDGGAQYNGDRRNSIGITNVTMHSDTGNTNVHFYDAYGHPIYEAALLSDAAAPDSERNEKMSVWYIVNIPYGISGGSYSQSIIYTVSQKQA